MLRSACRAVDVEPLLLRVDCQLLPFAAAVLPLFGNGMPERLPHVGQGVVERGPVAKDLEQGGIDQGLGIQGVEVIARSAISLSASGGCCAAGPRTIVCALTWPLYGQHYGITSVTTSLCARRCFR
jgi:hypothetical protein